MWSWKEGCHPCRSSTGLVRKRYGSARPWPQGGVAGGPQKGTEPSGWQPCRPEPPLPPPAQRVSGGLTEKAGFARSVCPWAAQAEQ